MAERIVHVVRADDLSKLEEADSEEQKKRFEPRLREILLNSDLPKNDAQTKLLKIEKTSLRTWLWAKLFSVDRDETSYTYDVIFPSQDRHLAKIVIMKTDKDKFTFELLGKRVTQDLIEDSTFDFRDKTLHEYFFLFVLFLVPAFIFYTLWLCKKTPFKGRWIWFIFISVGIIQFDLNWTTGRMGLRPVALILFGSQFSHPPDFVPWVLSTSVPIGAILFYWKRKSRK
jgi:hypothetical protein